MLCNKHLYQLLCISTIVWSVFSQCDGPKHKSEGNYNPYDDIAFAMTNNNHTANNYYPVNIGDSILYVGETHYMKMPDGFDTMYLDTIRIYTFYDNIFTYRVRELKYKWLEPLPGQIFDDITISQIRDSFQLNDSHFYELLIRDGEGTEKINMIFRAGDSMYYQDDDRDTKDKIKEMHTFRGKALK